ncbi:ABC transporter permease subunit [[Actinomadura] parvosata]|uniref:ABC transporter permease subunit n=1 Tax=[Actinomadura] parvosata TaxID=1955412 RepID=UPI00406C3B91
MSLRHMLLAEWTKLRTVRGWVAGLVAVSLVVVGLGLLFATGSTSSCSKGKVEVPCPTPPLGPDGTAVEDRFYFVSMPLDGNGSITARVNSMTGQIRLPDATPGVRNVVSGTVPWAKAGLMVKESTEQGSAYAAVMVTAAHGVRMQHDFTHDVAGGAQGVASGQPRWLRLSRTQDTVIGEESPDGKRWTKVGTARLEGLPARVRIGLFAASPGDVRVESNPLGGTAAAGRFSEVTALVDEVSVSGTTSGAWAQNDIGVDYDVDGTPHHPGRLVRNGGTFAITGVGDIAPNTTEGTVERTLTGMLIALVVAIVVAVLFVTTEYRRGLMRTTLLAGPRRGRVLVAKAVVAGGATFVAGLAGAAVTVPLAVRILRGNGIFTLPVDPLTQVRVIAGAAGVLAVSAVLALALGALFRRSAPAVIVAIVVLVVPYVLATASILPDEVSRWLLRVTPAAGFAIQQSVPEYEHVISHYVPAMGYFPLPPWGGFAVLCAYAALALGLAVRRLNGRDA